jgi:hypothetical protein
VEPDTADVAVLVAETGVVQVPELGEVVGFFTAGFVPEVDDCAVGTNVTDKGTVSQRRVSSSFQVARGVLHETSSSLTL